MWISPPVVPIRLGWAARREMLQGGFRSTQRGHFGRKTSSMASGRAGRHREGPVAAAALLACSCATARAETNGEEV